MTRRTAAVLAVIAGIVWVVFGVGRERLQAQRTARDQHVFVSIVDKNNAPVPGITVKDISVKEDSTTREVIRVEAATTPMQVVLLLDDSAATQPALAELRRSALAFVKQLLTDSPTSQISIATFGERPLRIADFGSDVDVLNHAIEKVFPRQGTGSYLLDAIMEATGALRKKEAVRPVIVALFAEDGPEFSAANRRQVETAMKTARVSLWTAVLQSRSLAAVSGSTERLERDQVASDVATASGGMRRNVLSAQSLEPSLKAIATLLTVQYDVTYARPETMVPPTSRAVSTSRQGLTVLASKWVTP